MQNWYLRESVLPTTTTVSLFMQKTRPVYLVHTKYTTRGGCGHRTCMYRMNIILQTKGGEDLPSYHGLDRVHPSDAGLLVVLTARAVCEPGSLDLPRKVEKAVAEQIGIRQSTYTAAHRPSIPSNISPQQSAPKTGII